MVGADVDGLGGGILTHFLFCVIRSLTCRLTSGPTTQGHVGRRLHAWSEKKTPRLNRRSHGLQGLNTTRTHCFTIVFTMVYHVLPNGFKLTET